MKDNIEFNQHTQKNYCTQCFLNQDDFKLSTDACTICSNNNCVYNISEPLEEPLSQKKSLDPKAGAGNSKVCFDSVPITLDIISTFGADNGADKYGIWNWLELEDGSMSLMTYVNALKRHWILFRAGQDKASDSKIHHLDHLIAGLAVVRDAMIFNKVNDDRVKLSDEQLEILEKLLNKE